MFTVVYKKWQKNCFFHQTFTFRQCCKLATRNFPAFRFILWTTYLAIIFWRKEFMKDIFWNHLTFTQFLFAFVMSQVFTSKKKEISKMPSSFNINLFDNFPYCFFRLIGFGLENLEGHNLFFENESIPASAYFKSG